MRKVFFTLLFAVVAMAAEASVKASETAALDFSEAVADVADDGARAVLQRVAEYVKKLGGYDAEFMVKAGDYSTTGRYGVDGDAYHIKVDQAEVYSDGRVRYEVDHERKEINVDNMDLSSRNIMDNPTRCFDFVGDDYTAEQITLENGRSTLHLRATDPAIEGDIYLTVMERTGRPIRILYVLYDDRIEVDITSLESRRSRVKSFSRGEYGDYELVDFR